MKMKEIIDDLIYYTHVRGIDAQNIILDLYTLDLFTKELEEICKTSIPNDIVSLVKFRQGYYQNYRITLYKGTSNKIHIEIV